MYLHCALCIASVGDAYDESVYLRRGNIFCQRITKMLLSAAQGSTVYLGGLVLNLLRVILCRSSQALIFA